MKNYVLVGLSYGKSIFFSGSISDEDIKKLEQFDSDDTKGMKDFDDGYSMLIGDKDIEELKTEMNDIWNELGWGDIEFEKLENGGNINVFELLDFWIGDMDD